MPFLLFPIFFIGIIAAIVAAVLGLVANLVLGMVFLCFITVFFTGLIYLLPSFIAWGRHHSQKGAILILNLLAGWTLIGWVAAFVWAFLDERPEPTLETRLEGLEKLKAAGKLSEEEYAKLRARELGL